MKDTIDIIKSDVDVIKSDIDVIKDDIILINNDIEVKIDIKELKNSNMTIKILNAILTI